MKLSDLGLHCISAEFTEDTAYGRSAPMYGFGNENLKIEHVGIEMTQLDPDSTVFFNPQSKEIIVAHVIEETVRLLRGVDTEKLEVISSPRRGAFIFIDPREHVYLNNPSENSIVFTIIRMEVSGTMEFRDLDGEIVRFVFE